MLAVEDSQRVSERKRALRQEMRRRVGLLPSGAEGVGEEMLRILRGTTLWRGSESMAGFVPFRREPDIWPVLRCWLSEGRRLFLPVFEQSLGGYALAEVKGLDESWLAVGRYGILEPLARIPRLNPPFRGQMPSLWLVPGLAFAGDGGRLGRGAGYYDRLLTGSTGIRVGVALDPQVVDEVPMDRCDVRMDYLLTETALLPIKTGRETGDGQKGIQVKDGVVCSVE